MLGVVGAKSLDALVDETVPESIRLARPLEPPRGEVGEPSSSSTRASSARRTA